MIHEKGRKSESNIDKIKFGKHLAKTCDVCFKTMRGDNLNRNMLKHEKGRKEEMTIGEQKDNEVSREALGVEQSDEIFKRKIFLECAERERKFNQEE